MCYIYVYVCMYIYIYVCMYVCISYFANICKFYVRMRSCSKQASRLATKLPVCVQYNVVKQNK